MPPEAVELGKDDLYENLQNTKEVFFQFLLDFKDYSVVILDSGGNVISWNAGAEHIYGYSEKEIIGKNVSIFYTYEDVQLGQPLKNLQLAAESGRHEFEVFKCKKDRTRFFTNTILTTLYNADKSVKGFAKVTRNIDRQKKLEAENKALTDSLEEKVRQRTHELAVVNNELEAFSYSVSHDLKTPLRAISGYGAMLKEDYESKLDSEGKRFINVIVDNSKMMGKLIDDLLTFSKMARLHIVTHFIDMRKLAESCLNELRLAEDLSKFSFSILNIPTCSGDANMLKQVLCNLLSNAVKYSSKKSDPAVEIGSADNENENVYYIKDNGAGFDMKYAKNLFGVFQRLHRHDEFEGTGLGLALAKRIVTKHGGKMWAEAHLNEGATFYFSIPK